MLEERDDLLDRVLHAVELAERGIAPDDAVAEDAAEARSLRVSTSSGSPMPASMRSAAVAYAQGSRLQRSRYSSMLISSACVAE